MPFGVVCLQNETRWFCPRERWELNKRTRMYMLNSLKKTMSWNHHHWLIHIGANYLSLNHPETDIFFSKYETDGTSAKIQQKPLWLFQMSLSFTESYCLSLAKIYNINTYLRLQLFKLRYFSILAIIFSLYRRKLSLCISLIRCLKKEKNRKKLKYW